MGQRDAMENWGRNVRYSAKEIVRVRDVEEVVRVVKGNARVRALGTRHSFNGVADTEGVLVDVSGLTRHGAEDEVTLRRGWVQLEPGITFGELGKGLEGRGFNIENYPSLPHVCVGGGVMTGTHGSGTGNLSTLVVSMQFVTADGEVRRISKWDVDFKGAVVSMGQLGILTSLMVEVVPRYQVVQEVYENVPAGALAARYSELIGGAYSLSLFTRWLEGVVDQVWVKRLVGAKWKEPAVLARRKSGKKLHPIREVDPAFCTEQGRPPGPAHERLPHFRMEFEPSSAGAELQSEYFVARADLRKVMRVMGEIGPKLQACLMISEVRSVDKDGLWMSPCYGRDSVGIHFTWRPMEGEVLKLLREVVEPALRPFRPRPHWGKVFTLGAEEVMGQYERLGDFRALCEKWDPAGKFRNGFTRRYVFGEG